MTKKLENLNGGRRQAAVASRTSAVCRVGDGMFPRGIAAMHVWALVGFVWSVDIDSRRHSDAMVFGVSRPTIFSLGLMVVVKTTRSGQ